MKNNMVWNEKRKEIKKIMEKQQEENIKKYL